MKCNHNNWSFSISNLILAVAVQVGILLLTVFVVVFVPSDNSEPKFGAAKTIYLSQRELEHQIYFTEHQQVMSNPQCIKLLSTAALLNDTLPQLPSFPMKTFNPST